MRFVLAFCAALLATTAPALAAPGAPTPDAPTPAATPADPARLAAARRTVDYVFPLGTYARLMNGTMDKMMDSLMDSMMDMPVKDLAGIGGVDTPNLGAATTAQIMEIYDPAYRERLHLATRTMMAEMSTMMTQFEPDIRDGLAGAYAARFDARQLADLNAFFATPTGKIYAADSYLIMMSPEVMTKMQKFTPQLMQQIPGIVEKVKAATASLPPMRKYSDLSEAEKVKMAKILGIERSALDKTEAAKEQAKTEE
ncbi:hypothetical protein WSK_2420 [Novosphingobium sp. Rr 2-17]|uniref:DUF2059 domain-containing protein n=1 Tax=Novosphingobium sp. Rr 2-17 TaxID=555793 RepID=UPI000269A820|nr:DUF2059 domain-containing protein [Novosphingobium sp. Rr 2-17]EIZ78877.1 hypothetical protein WSK_2420 [Novosphingobium sp. Rr 2-17]